MAWGGKGGKGKLGVPGVVLGHFLWIFRGGVYLANWILGHSTYLWVARAFWGCPVLVVHARRRP